MRDSRVRSSETRRSMFVMGSIVAVMMIVGTASWYLWPRAQTVETRGTASPDLGASSPIATPSPPEAKIVENFEIDDGGFEEASRFTGAIRDPESLESLRTALAARGPSGLAKVGAELENVEADPDPSMREATQEAVLLKSMGQILMYEGKFPEADARFESVLAMGRSHHFPPLVTDQMMLLRGVVALRRGEVDNCIGCLGPSSCIFPIVPEARHIRPSGSREAITHFAAYLKAHPGDLRARWLLNLAYMTLGEHPEKVPPADLIEMDLFRSRSDVGRFVNVAIEAGLTSRGPNLAGGAVFDDLTGDGRPDLLTTSLDFDRGASLFVNQGDGTFQDRSAEAGLDAQIYALNVARADFDNDGDLDVLLLRGAWEHRMRMSLLRNRGDGTFEDITIAAGLGEPISSESAAWGDYDSDGLIDLFVCGEYSSSTLDLANRSRLYRNKGDGTFEDVAMAAGVANTRLAKGCAWGDYDNDGRLDLFVSNRTEPCRHYRNLGNGTFRDEAPSLAIEGTERNFACAFWDYNNDGRLDIFVNDYSLTLAENVALILGQPIDHPSGPRLYRNEGESGFRDVTREVGLDPAISAMGANFGDVDNDGDLDLYFGTGGMSYSYLVPNRMFENISGERFEDVTTSSGTGHLQKGHGISFADFDDDGDLDLFVEAGGGVPGDRSFNILYRNPNQGRGSIQVKLVGTKTNRAALGARIRAVVEGPEGSRKSIYRTVGNNMSFGGNTLVETLGVGEADGLSELEITWPTSQTIQTFRDIPSGTSIEVTEGASNYQVIHGPRHAD